MEIFLNNQPLQFKMSDGETVEDVVKTLFHWLEDDGGRIQFFDINGKPLEEIYESIKYEPYTVVNTMKIESDPPQWILDIENHENPIEYLEMIVDSLLKKEEDVKSFSVNIQMENPLEAYQSAAHFVHEVRQMITVLHRLEREGLVNLTTPITSGITLQEYFDSIQHYLKEINGALQDNDMVLTGDLFEYEILPLINSIKEFLPEIRK